MNEQKIQSLVLDAITLTNQSREDFEQIPVAQDTALYGAQGNLDSMGLVALLIDIEEMLQDKGINVSLSDERAMSMANSPFKNVPTLVTHISSLVQGA
jgi:acyl carrier protein